MAALLRVVVVFAAAAAPREEVDLAAVFAVFVVVLARAVLGAAFFVVLRFVVLRFVVLRFAVAGAVLAVDLFAVDEAVLVADARFVAEVVPAAARFAVVVFFAAPDDARDVVLADVLAAAFGSFFEPSTKDFSSVPGRNFGTDVFLTRTRAPVAGLRAVRAARSTFSKAPKPVMTTFSPLTTLRVMTSSTDSSACCALFLLPSNLFDSSPTNCALFTLVSLRGATSSDGRRPLQGKR